MITGDNHNDSEVAKSALCTACGNVADYEDHFQPSPHYHPFESNVRNAPDATMIEDVTGESRALQVAHEASAGG